MMQSKLFACLAVAAMTVAAGPSAADVVLNEVVGDPVGPNSGFQKVELYNNGSSPESLDGLFLCAFPSYWGLPAVTLDPGAYLIVHWNTDGVDVPGEAYTGTTGVQDLGNPHSLAIYENTGAGPQPDWADPAMIRDFVQWGAGNQMRSDVADSAGIWDATLAVTVPAEGLSLGLLPDGQDTNSTDDWVGSQPTPGTGNAVSVTRLNWGRIKELFAE